jgi:transposase, IS5 family
VLHGEESVVFADAGNQGASKRPEATRVDWHISKRPGKGQAQKHTPWAALSEQVEKLRASVRDKVECAFRVLKCQFGFVNARYSGLAKNMAQLMTLVALCSLWVARKSLMQTAQG